MPWRPVRHSAEHQLATSPPLPADEGRAETWREQYAADLAGHEDLAAALDLGIDAAIDLAGLRPQEAAALRDYLRREPVVDRRNLHLVNAVRRLQRFGARRRDGAL